MTQPSALRKSVLPNLGADSLTPPTENPRFADSETQLPALAAPAPEAAVSPFAGTSLSPSDLAASFRPTEQQALCRSRFWSRMADRPLAAGAVPGLALAQQMTGSGSLAGWWRQGGFKEWFLNERALDEQVDWLMHLALRAAEDVLKNEDPKSAGARVAMVKTIAEMSGRLAKASGANSAGSDKKAKAIGAMSKEEIMKLLGDQGIQVERVIQVQAGTPTTPE